MPAATAIVAAEVDLTDPLAPRSPAFDDLYHARQGAFAQASHVFLAGNGLPGRWQGRERFVVLETGFGLGNNFLATWQAWRDDPARPRRLHFISIEKHPLCAADLRRVHAASPAPALADALCAAWPPLTPDLHRLAFDDGRVELLLVFGDVVDALRDLVASVDAFYLDGFAPARNPRMWEPAVFKSVSRLAAPLASAATWSAAAAVRDGLRDAGFDVVKAPGSGGKRDILHARFAPRAPARRPAFRVGHAGTRRVAVIGGGLAGAFAARALAAQGLECVLVDAAPALASGASGNPAGLFHGVFHPQDGPHARALRASVLAALPDYAQAIADGVPGHIGGMLRLVPDAADEAALADALAASGLPPEFIATWPAAAVLAAGGAAHPAWHYPGAGWIAPAKLVAWAADAPGVQLLCGRRVEQLVRQSSAAGAEAPAGRWSLLDATGATIAEADAVVLANALDVPRLCAGLVGTVPAGLHGPLASPLAAARGQVSWATMATAPVAADAAADPARRPITLPLAGAGYALPLPDGHLLFGATNQADDPDPAVRADDHVRNLTQLALLTGRTADELFGAAMPADIAGRTGWRATTADRLPWVGALPVAAEALGDAAAPDQPRRWPRVPGLFVVSGLGSRGLTWAPLAGRLIAAWVTDAPFPVGAKLIDALDPARFSARAVRSAASALRKASPAGTDPPGGGRTPPP